MRRPRRSHDERVPTFRRSQHSFYAAGAPRAAGRGGARDSRSRNRGAELRVPAPGRGRAQVRREARVSLKLTGFSGGVRAGSNQEPAGGWLPTRAEGRGGLSFGAVAAAGSPSARRRRCCRMRSPSAAWLLGGVLLLAASASCNRTVAGERLGWEGSRCSGAGVSGAVGWRRTPGGCGKGECGRRLLLPAPGGSAPGFGAGGLRGPSWDHQQGLKPVEASGRQRGVRVYGRPGGLSPSPPHQPQVSLQILVIKELSHTFQTLLPSPARPAELAS